MEQRNGTKKSSIIAKWFLFEGAQFYEFLPETY